MPRRSKAETTEVLQRRFIDAYRGCGNIRRAAELADIARSTHFHWMADPAYAAEFAAAGEDAADVLELEARRRALEGHDEPVVYQGALQYLPKFSGGKLVMKDGRPVLTDKPLTVRKFSDVLLIFLLKGLRPDKYRDNFKGEITGAAALFVKQAKADLSKLSDDEIAFLESLHARLISRSGGAGGGENEAGSEPHPEVLPE